MRSVLPDEHVSLCPHCRREGGGGVPREIGGVDGESFVRHVRDGHDVLRSFKQELNSLCTSQQQYCQACPQRDRCAQLGSDVIARLLNAATDAVHQEQVFMNRHRANAQRRRYFAEHAASHDLMINDLSSYAMECDRLPPIDLIAAATLLLKYWTESHASYHDAVLCDIALNETVAESHP